MRSRNSSLPLDSKYASTSLGAELLKNTKFRNKTANDGINNNTSSIPIPPVPRNQSLQSSQSLPSHHPSSSSLPLGLGPNDMNLIHPNLVSDPHQSMQHNGYENLRPSTLPSLPLPVVGQQKPSSSRMNQSSLALGTRLTQLPLPNVPLETEDEEQTRGLVERRRPRILNKVYPQYQEQNPRCVDVFDIISQIGEGTYGQVYKAEDKINKSTVALKKVRLENEKEGFPITAVNNRAFLIRVFPQAIFFLTGTRN